MSENTTSQDSAQVEASEIVDQTTLEQALAQEPVDNTQEENISQETEPSEEPQLELKEQPRKILGKYNTPEEAEKAYNSLEEDLKRKREEHRQLTEQLKAAKEAQQDAQMKSFESMDYEEQTKFLAQQVADMRQQLAESRTAQEQLAQQHFASDDQKQMEEFITKNTLLQESGMEDMFRMVANQPQYREYSFDSIFKTLFQPKIEKLMGKKIKVREKPVVNTPKEKPKPKAVKDLSRGEYEKNREQILREAGVNI